MSDNMKHELQVLKYLYKYPEYSYEFSRTRNTNQYHGVDLNVDVRGHHKNRISSFFA